ncbi:hypothetical protein Agub_g4510, partial [Astrephomene gubernaculifera]
DGPRHRLLSTAEQTEDTGSTGGHCSLEGNGKQPADQQQRQQHPQRPEKQQDKDQQQQHPLVVLREEPPFEEDGQQGHAWRDRSGVDFRAPLSWYGTALAALPYDPHHDLLWVCSDDADLAARAELGVPVAATGGGEVRSVRGTSWTAVLRQVQQQEEEEARRQEKKMKEKEEKDQQQQQHHFGGDEGARLRCVGCPSGAVPPRGAAPMGVPSSPAPSSTAAPLASTSRLASASLPPAASSTAPSAAAAAVPVLTPSQQQLLAAHGLLADWFIMQRADVLLASNSTLSFTAAMLNE